eukprot:1019395-Amphidinium_carterae.1
MERRVTSKIVLPTPWTRVRLCHVRVEKACNHGSPERLVLAYSEFRMAYATVMTCIGSLALDFCGVWCVASGEHAHALVTGLCDSCACVVYAAQVSVVWILWLTVMGCDVFWIGVTCTSLIYSCGCFVRSAFTCSLSAGSLSMKGCWLIGLCLDCLAAGKRAYQGRVQWCGVNEARLFGPQSNQCSVHFVAGVGYLPDSGDACARCGAGFPAQDQSQSGCGRTSWGAKILFDPKWPPHCLFEAMAFCLRNGPPSMEDVSMVRCAARTAWEAVASKDDDESRALVEGWSAFAGFSKVSQYVVATDPEDGCSYRCGNTADVSCAAKMLEVPFHVYDENGACILKVGRGDQVPHCIAYTANHFVVIDPQDANLQDPRGELSLTVPFRGAEDSQVVPWARQQQALVLDSVTQSPRVPWLDISHLGDVDFEQPAQGWTSVVDRHSRASSSPRGGAAGHKSGAGHGGSVEHSWLPYGSLLDLWPTLVPQQGNLGNI